MGRTPYVVSLADLRASDLPLAGGKGANLGELMHAGFPVPDGFCVTTAAFSHFLDGVLGLEDLFGALRVLDVENVAAVREVGALVRAALTRADVPEAVAADVRMWWRRTGADATYAARSSATAEDLPNASFAGQQDTILDVRGEAELLAAVRRCWVSLFTDRAIVYRVRNGFDHRAVRLAVVVQRMVLADASGVLFTVDPVTQHRYTLVIDAVKGLGEALVAGQVSPDAYRVDRRGMGILGRTLGDRADAEAGPVLDDDQILELARLGSDVEAYLGPPQDLEWAIAAGHFHLLQSRPITSLYPIDTLRSPDGSLHVHFSLGHQQSMTRAMTPLSLSNVPVLLPGGRVVDAFERSFVHVAGSRLFVDLTQLLRHRLGRRVAMGMLSQLDALAPDAVRASMERPEFRDRPPPRLSFGTLRVLAGIARRVVGAVVWRDLTGFRDLINRRMDAFEAEARQRIQSAPLGRERAEAALEAVHSVFPFLLTFIPVVAAGIVSTRMLTRLARPWLEAGEVEALTLGVPGNVVNDMNLAIDKLADVARRSPELVARFDDLGVDAHMWLAAAEEVDGGAAFARAFGAFLDRYGARCAAEIDLAMPRWRENPLPVLKVIAGLLRSNGPTYSERMAAYEAGRVAAFERLVRAARRGLIGPLRLRVIRRLYRTMVEVGGMREHHKLAAVRVFAMVKDAVIELADRLVERNQMDAPDDVWFLTWPELLGAWGHEAADLRAHIARRRASHDRDQRLTPPMIITSDGEVPYVRYRRDEAPDGALVGNPVSAGVVEGTARIVRDPGRDELVPGEILVAEFTDPGWTPLFINASGLVLEVGGALTHGAVVAREYGIPAVVGVRGATRAIVSGQRLRVDGDRGVVEVLGEDEGLGVDTGGDGTVGAGHAG